MCQNLSLLVLFSLSLFWFPYVSVGIKLNWMPNAMVIKYGMLIFSVFDQKKDDST
jgi:hypothetical protein